MISKSLQTVLSSNLRLHAIGIGNLILSLGGLIPGHILAILTIDTVGRKTLQMGGFAILTALLSIVGFGFYRISIPGRIILFCLSGFIANAGPNTTTFILPAEWFPIRYKATAYGISAAAGKIGAIASQAIFGTLEDKLGINHIMEIYALFMY